MGNALINLAGQTIGRWTVLHKVPDLAGTIWHCRCVCGEERNVRGNALRDGRSQSCGCLQRERASTRPNAHHGSLTRLYGIWRNMKKRCQNPNAKAFKHYGGRGIMVCATWQKFPAFRDWAARAGYAEDLTIERLDVDGNYEPSNCTWIPAADQARNTRRQLRDETGLAWVVRARENGIAPQMYAQRVWRGWEPGRAASQPKRVQP